MTAINTTTYEGLDYDPRRGYEPDNVRLVCALANFAMNAWGLEPLSRWQGPWPTNMPRRLEIPAIGSGWAGRRQNR
jgi:hypothetical protein